MGTDRSCIRVAKEGLKEEQTQKKNTFARAGIRVVPNSDTCGSRGGLEIDDEAYRFDGRVQALASAHVTRTIAMQYDVHGYVRNARWAGLVELYWRATKQKWSACLIRSARGCERLHPARSMHKPPGDRGVESFAFAINAPRRLRGSIR